MTTTHQPTLLAYQRLDPRRSHTESVIEAAECYRRREREEPNVCELHEADLLELEHGCMSAGRAYDLPVTVAGLEGMVLRAAPYVKRGEYRVGRMD